MHGFAQVEDALDTSLSTGRASLGLGCLASPSRGYTLYPSPDGARPDESQVAQLTGYLERRA